MPAWTARRTLHQSLLRPNCETVIEGGRVFIEALRDIRKGEELGYEYGLTWERPDDRTSFANYACRCGGRQVPRLDARPGAARQEAQAEGRAQGGEDEGAPARKKARK